MRVSIHAPRVGARLSEAPYTNGSGRVSIHAPRVGARPYNGHQQLEIQMFQSTRPAWGRDGVSAQIESLERSFNPRAPRGGATGVLRRAEARGSSFNPRAPRGGATAGQIRHLHTISFHPPRLD